MLELVYAGVGAWCMLVLAYAGATVSWSCSVVYGGAGVCTAHACCLRVVCVVLP